MSSINQSGTFKLGNRQYDVMLQVPPVNPSAGPMSFGGPPAAITRFSRSPATNATETLSGDQNGNAASSVPATLVNFTSFTGRM